jgi:hypothetical protein
LGDPATSAYIYPVDPKLRIVTQLPLRGLWRETGSVSASRLRALSSRDIRDLLRLGPVQFVVVDVGLKPRWIDLEACYGFWLDEAQHHVVEPQAESTVSQLVGVYCYLASEWESEEVDSPIIVLELRH